MSIIKCNNGHFYDSRSKKCPYCEENSAPEINGERTEAVYGSILSGEITVPFGENNDDSKTISIFSADNFGTLYVVGWLVCVAGSEIGQDYRLHSGRNQLGRSPQMDICIFNDSRLNRENHCQIIFDDVDNTFYICSENGGIVYLNGTLLDGVQVLHDGDEIQAGSSTLVFTAYCRGERKW